MAAHRYVLSNQTVMAEGEPGREMYMIISGELEVTAAAAAAAQHAAATAAGAQHAAATASTQHAAATASTQHAAATAASAQHAAATTAHVLQPAPPLSRIATRRHSPMSMPPPLELAARNF